MGPAAAAFESAGLHVQAQALLVPGQFLPFARSLPNPVALIPLEASRFASCKSAVKWFEYAGAGIPVLCSDVPPYADVVQQGRTGTLVTNDSGAWHDAIGRIVADTDLRQRLAAAAMADVQRRFTLGHSAAAWRLALQRALERRSQAQLPAPGPLGRLGELLLAAWEAPVRRLRELNRQRLARRSRR